MNIKDLLKTARNIWPNKIPLEHIAVAIGVNVGDINRQARNKLENRPVNDQEVKKELGNTILSCIRWCDDLGFDPEECIELAEKAQRKYAQQQQNQ